MKKSCFNCRHLYSAGRNMFTCSKHINKEKMKLHHALDNICDYHEHKSMKNEKDGNTFTNEQTSIFYS